jgi:hypothetical protein
MKVLAALMMLYSLPVPRLVAPVPQLAAPASASAAHPHGKWYLAETGHAVYCYGPVKMVNNPFTGMHRVATFCKGDQLVVPLKD